MSKDLPRIFRDSKGVLSFECPVCCGGGRLTTMQDGSKLPVAINACPHCFGFGRLPVPLWYSRQLVANATGDSIGFVDEMLNSAKEDL